MQAVIEGAADIAPIDAYALELMRRFEPEMTTGLRVVARTAPTAIPVLVATDERALALTPVLLAAHESEDTRTLLSGLSLRRFRASGPRGLRGPARRLPRRVAVLARPAVGCVGSSGVPVEFDGPGRGSSDDELPSTKIPASRRSHVARGARAVFGVDRVDLVSRADSVVVDHAGRRIPGGLAFLAPARSDPRVSRRAGVAAFRGRLSAARVVVSLPPVPQEPPHPSPRRESDDPRRRHRVVLRHAGGLGTSGPPANGCC